MDVEEMIAIFLHIISHDVNNRIIKRQVTRSSETISRQFHAVLNSLLRLHSMLLRKPEAVMENCTDERWKWFKNCLGALDGTYIKVNVEEADKPRYRSCKGEIATNVLGVCYYYLCDAGYANAEGFLAPYRGQRYHMNEWRQSQQSTNAHEFFNMKHSRARNVIERCFGLLKGRWAILRSKSFYSVKTQYRIISACCLLHNFIIEEMPIDPMNIEVVEDVTSSQEKETKTEDAKLVECLIEVVNASGWKSDNGTFRPGFHQHLERMMEKKLPGCGLRENPRIENHVKLLKKQYNAIAEMLGPNYLEFGWNDREKCVVADKDVYDLWVKSHPHAAGLRNKPFPYYEDLSIVFGKDRPNGEGAEDPTDACEQIEKEEEALGDTMSLEDDMNAEGGSPNAIDSPPSICQPTGVGTSTATIGKKKGSLVSKKRKHNDTIIENLVTEMEKISSACEGSKEDFKKIANFFEKKGQSDERRMALFEEIMKIEDLSEDDMLIAGEVISKYQNWRHIALRIIGDNGNMWHFATLLGYC
ncbi:uncharacterized protein LOC103697538 [Phoenix dactylifera]|uniref:Uncharacterized protein LOC103697538 n=1 Tax=Phoenix dactylifera TaxID=42345 RepID=A0A8B7BIF4_PHODC|nr:uncharacterized protein LOC103697538 [Phoenix dactylifera]